MRGDFLAQLQLRILQTPPRIWIRSETGPAGAGRTDPVGGDIVLSCRSLVGGVLAGLQRGGDVLTAAHLL